MERHAANCGQLDARVGNPFLLFSKGWCRGEGGSSDSDNAQVQNLQSFACSAQVVLPFSAAAASTCASASASFPSSCCCQVVFGFIVVGVIFIFIFIFMGITIKCLGYLFDTLLEQFQLPASQPV